MEEPKTEELSERENQSLDTFCSLLFGCEGYLLDKSLDEGLYFLIEAEYPSVDILEETKSLIARWKKDSSSFDEDPRQQLSDWLRREHSEE